MPCIKKNGNWVFTLLWNPRTSLWVHPLNNGLGPARKEDFPVSRSWDKSPGWTAQLFQGSFHCTTCTCKMEAGNRVCCDPLVSPRTKADTSESSAGSSPGAEGKPTLPQGSACSRKGHRLTDISPSSLNGPVIHFADEETKFPRSERTCPRSASSLTERKPPRLLPSYALCPTPQPFI